MTLRSLSFLFLLSIAWSAYCQKTASDSVFLLSEGPIEQFESVSKLNPNKAALLSAVLPGLGQAYNNQFWKLPIIYGGALIFGHYINYNHKVYNELKNALVAQVDSDPNTINYYEDLFSATSLERNRDLFRRNRDFLILIAGTFYMLNIVDAHVSAHLKEFDINENLSMAIYPQIQSSPLNSPTVGIQMAVRIR